MLAEGRQHSNNKEVSWMSILQKFEPRKKMVDVKRAPLAPGMDEFFEGFMPRRWMEAFEPFGFGWPKEVDHEPSFRLDMIDREKELVVRGELPGVDRDGIEITISGDRLTIEAERKFEEKEEMETFYRHEVGYGKLMRTMALPVEVDAEHVVAELRDGILEVKLPKAQPAERHTIKVA